MQRSRVLAPTLKNAMLPSSTRVFSSRRPLSSAAAVAEYSSTNSTVGAIRRRPWEQAILKACANRKQVLVSLDSVLDVSTGKRPWRISFGEANPEVQPGAEPEFARPACKSYVSNAERRRMTEGILQSAQYLHRELPVRIAYAVTELDKMKDTGLTDTLPVARVRENYLQSFRELQEIPRPHDTASVAAFTETVGRVQERGGDTVVLMACGLRDLMRDSGGDLEKILREGGGKEEERMELRRVQEFLDKFYQNRVAARFHCGHYLALSNSQPRDGFVGLVHRSVSLTEIAQGAALEAATICCHALGSCPEVRMSVDRSGDGLVTAVPEYVHYVVLELLKNAMRATMQTHSKGGDSPMAAAAAVDDAPGAEGRVKGKKAPAARERGGGGGDKQEKKGSRLNAPIVFSDVPELVISIRAKGEEDVELVVADQGGGIENEATDKVWSYLYTTAGEDVKDAYLANGGNSASAPPPLAGLGYGLPLSRLYARNFGGELQLRSVAGKGMKATLRLSRHGTRLEPLVWPQASDEFEEVVASRVNL